MRNSSGPAARYRYTYTIHGAGHTYVFDDRAKLNLTINGPVEYTVERDKIVVRDGRSEVGNPLFASGDWFKGTDEEYKDEASTYIAYSGPLHVDEGGMAGLAVAYWGVRYQTWIQLPTDVPV